MKLYNFKKSFISVFVLFFSLNSIAQQNFSIPISDCINPISGSTEGWGLYWVNGFYSQTQFLSDTSISSFLMGSLSINSVLENQNNPNLGKRISIANTNQIHNDINTSNLNQNNLAKYLRIGGDFVSSSITPGSEEVKRTYEITPDNAQLTLNIYTVFSNFQSNTLEDTEFFKYKIIVKYDDGTLLNLPLNVSDFFLTHLSTQDNDDYFYDNKKIYKNDININFNDYNIDFCKNPLVTLSFMVSDATSNNNNSVYAYIHGRCNSTIDEQFIDTDTKLCINVDYTLQIDDLFANDLQSGDVVKWTITNSLTGDIVNLLGNNAHHIFTISGDYIINLKIIKVNPNCEIVIEREIQVSSLCQSDEENEETNTTVTPRCIDCTSFNLMKNEKYIVSGWTKLMKETAPNNFSPDSPLPTYNNVYIGISFLDINNLPIGGSEIQFFPTGEIIDGWQKITGEITIPNAIDDIKISLVNQNQGNISAFFDDIRVHPYNGNLKSFVYDQATQKLMAELDENNYSTFYEYDKEGGLIRVKKETKNGVYTIQETRSSTIKN